MSEDRTRKLNEPNSFVERVDRMETRITNLEERQYDTKPIWERALAEIAETNRKLTELAVEMRASNEVLRSDFQMANEALRNDLRFEFLTVSEALRNDLKSEFLTVNEALRNDLKSEFQSANEALRNDLKSEFRTGIEGLRSEMKAEFASARHEMAHELRGVARKIDTLNHNFLEMQTEQRYFDRRLEELETQIKPT